MNDETMILIVLSIFVIGIIAIWLETKLGFPFGFYDGIVLFPLPPFIKRIRICGKWLGFDKSWKFIFFKEIIPE